MPEPELPPDVSELEALLNRKEAAAVLDAILGSAPSGAFIVRAPDARIVRISDYAARLVGRPRGDVEGRPLEEALPVQDISGRPLPAGERPLLRALRGETVTDFDYGLEAASGELIPCVANAAPICNWRGELIGAIGLLTDLRRYTHLEQSLREAVAYRDEALMQSRAMYRDLAHRVKNHLQVLSALAALESRDPTLSPEDMARQTKGQLNALAAVYRGMERAEAGDGINARAFLDDVCRPYASKTVSVETAVAPPGLILASGQAGPIGMLVNEAVSNSRKSAFPEQGGHIRVSLRRTQPGRLRLEVGDDGEGWARNDRTAASPGLHLMQVFARQLHSELELGGDPRGGASVAAEMPEAVV